MTSSTSSTSPPVLVPAGRPVVLVPPGRAWAGGIGSMPGTDVTSALTMVLDILGGRHVPFVPELPARGVGSDMIGRGAAILVDMPVDLQPSGWRLVDAPGRDLSRARSWLRQDLDVLSEVADGYAGPFSVSVTGPWTLAAALQRSRGEVALADRGARRDIAQSLAEGIRVLLADLSRAVPGAGWLLQIDEPSLPMVLRGGIPTISGFGRLPAVEAAEVRTTLADLLTRARDDGATATAVHCCAAEAPARLLAATKADVVGVDVTAATTAGTADAGSARWEFVAELVEAGGHPALGVAATDEPGRPGPTRSPVDLGRDDARAVGQAWQRLGLAPALLSSVGVTPVCGLAGATASGAAAMLRRVVAAADALHEASSATA